MPQRAMYSQSRDDRDFVAQFELEVQVAADIARAGNAQRLAAVETNPLLPLYRRGHHNAKAAMRAGYRYHADNAMARAAAGIT